MCLLYTSVINIYCLIKTIWTVWIVQPSRKDRTWKKNTLRRGMTNMNVIFVGKCLLENGILNYTKRAVVRVLAMLKKCSNAKSVARLIITQATWGETSVITQVETYYSVTCALLGGSTVSMSKRQETGSIHANTVTLSLWYVTFRE